MPNRRRVLFAWEWGAGAGHLAKIAPLARHLTERGYDVTVALRDLSDAKRFFSGHNIQIRQAPTLVPRKKDLFRDPWTLAAIAWNLGYDREHRVAAFVDAWRGLITDTRPTIVFNEFGIGPLIAARTLDLPVVQIGTGFGCPPCTSPLSRLRMSHQPLDTNGEQVIDHQLLQFINSALAQCDCQDVASIGSILANAEQTLLSTVMELDAYDRDCSEDDYLGIWDKTRGNAPHWSSRTGVKALAYLKASPDADNLLRALCQGGIEIVVAGGLHGLAGQTRIDHPLIRYSDDMVDMTLAHDCDFLINNGGHGSTLRMLSMGVPVLALPLFIEQRLTAARLNEFGLGVGLLQKGRQDVGEMIRRLTASKTKDNVHGFAGKYCPRIEQSFDRVTNRIVDFCCQVA